MCRWLQLEEIPFEVLERLRETGATPAAAAVGGHSRARKEGALQTAEFKRMNKNRPLEMSSKRPVPRFRDSVQAPKR